MVSLLLCRSSGDFEEIAQSSGSYLPPPSPYKEPIPPVRNVSNSPPLPPPHSPSEDTIYYTPQDPPIKSTGNYKNMEEFGDEEFQTTCKPRPSKIDLISTADSLIYLSVII